MICKLTLYKHVYFEKLILNWQVLNSFASPQKFKYLISLLSKTKQLTHEKVDHLSIQKLKNKQTSGTDNHPLNKNNEINYLFHCYVLSFANLLHIVLNKFLCLRILDGDIFQTSNLTLSFLFMSVLYSTMTLRFLSDTTCFQTLWLVLKFLEAFLEPIKIQKSHKNFWMPLQFSYGFL